MSQRSFHEVGLVTLESSKGLSSIGVTKHTQTPPSQVGSTAISHAIEVAREEIKMTSLAIGNAVTNSVALLPYAVHGNL